MKTRLLSASVGIPVLIAALWAGNQAIGAIVVAAAAIAGWELGGMAAARSERHRGRVLMVLWPVTLAAAGWAASAGAAWWLVPAVAGGGLAVAAAARLAGAPVHYGYLLAAGPCVGLLLAHGPLLRGLESGGEWLALALFGTFAIDSAAMLTGMAVGRRPLAPRISPQKTWEGTLGGALAGVVAVAALDAVLGLGLGPPAAAALGAAMAAGATLGDLGESALKRHAGVKDSGVLVPGHGGVLDRLDSILPNIAIVYWVAYFVSTWSAD